MFRGNSFLVDRGQMKYVFVLYLSPLLDFHKPLGLPWAYVLDMCIHGRVLGAPRFFLLVLLFR